jgi:hypothetical protein
MALLTLLLAFGLLFFFIGKREAVASSRSLSLFRALFPSWRFFDELGSVSRLYYRTGENADSLGSWRKCVVADKRTWSALFLNPAGNFHLAENTLIDQLSDELEAAQENGAPPIEASVSFRLVLNLVRRQIFSPLLFQFKITQLDQGESAAREADVLISAVYES